MKRRLLIAGLAITLLLLAVAGWTLQALEPLSRKRGARMT